MEIFGADGFKGIAPKFSKDKWPTQLCENFRVDGGALVPMSAPGILSVRTPAIPSGEVPWIGKPYMLTTGLRLYGTNKICLPYGPQANEAQWLSIWAYAFSSYRSPVDGDLIRQSTGEELAVSRVEYTPGGMRIHTPGSGFTFTVLGGVSGATYSITGPVIVCYFTNDSAGCGGPLGLPTSPSSAYPLRLPYYDELTDLAQFPTIAGGSVPLFYGGKQYGEFQIVGYNGPIWNQEVEVPKGVTTYVNGSDSGHSNAMSFEINCNYIDPHIRHRAFCVSLYHPDTRREGPPSNPTAIIATNPGEVIPFSNLPTGTSPFTTRRIYGSNSAPGVMRNEDASGFELLAEVPAGPSAFEITPALTGLGVGIPPFGAYAENTNENSPLAKTTFLAGSVLHPGDFGVAFTNKTAADGNNGVLSQIIGIALAGTTILVFTGPATGASYYVPTLWVSDVKRFHAWPLEYTLTSFLAPNAVYAVSGMPGNMNAHLVSTSHGMLNAGSLCQIGETVYWSTNDGLAASNGGTPELMTESFFSPVDWRALAPTTFTAQAADGIVYLVNTGNALAIGVKEGNSGVTTFTAGTDNLPSGKYQGTWISGIKTFAQPRIIDYIRVRGTGSAKITLTDETLSGGVTLNSVAMDAFTATQWTASFKNLVVKAESLSGSTISSIEIYERNIIEAGDGVHLTPENAPIIEDVWLHSPSGGRFVAGSFATDDGSTPTILIQGPLKTENSPPATVSPLGRFFTLPRSTNTNPLRPYFRVSATATAKITALDMVCRTKQPIGKGLRAVYSGGGIPEWLTRTYVADANTWIKSVTVLHAKPTGTLSMNLYNVETGATSTPGSIISGAEIVLQTSLGRCGSLDFDFAGDDAYVTQVIVTAQETQQIGPGGINLNGSSPSLRGLEYSFQDASSGFAVGSFSGSGDMTLTITVDGTAKSPITLSTDTPVFYIDPSWKGQLWGIDIDPCGNQLHAFTLLPFRRESIPGKVIRMAASDGQIAPWGPVIFATDTPVEIASIIVKRRSGTDAVTMNKFLDGSTATTDGTTSTSTVAIDDDKQLAHAAGPFNSIRVNFGEDDAKVSEFSIYLRDPQPMGPGGIDIPGDNIVGIERYADEPLEMACAVLTADSYSGNPTLTLKHDTTTENAIMVTSAEPFYLNRKLTGKRWVASVDAKGAKVEHLQVLPRQIVPQEGSIHMTAQAGQLRPWATAIFQYAKPADIVSMMTIAESYPVSLRVYKDRSDTPATISIRGSEELLLPDMEGTQWLEFNYGTSDPKVKETFFFERQTFEVGAARGLIIPNGGPRKSWLKMRVNFKDTGSFGVARILGTGITSNTPATLTLTPLGGSPVVVSIGDHLDKPLTLPIARQWDVSLSAPGRVDALHLVGAVHEAFNGKFFEMKHADNPASWLNQRVRAPRPIAFTRYAVNASAYPVTVEVYRGGVLLDQIKVQDGNIGWFPRWETDQDWGFSIIEQDGVIIHSAKFAIAGDYLRT